MKIRITVYSRERWLEVGTVIGWRALLRDLRLRRACGLTAWQLLPTQ
jgi:hypothetical protein